MSEFVIAFMKEFMRELEANGIVLILVFLPCVLVMMDIVFALKKKKKFFFECIAFGIGFIYMALAFEFWGPLEYDEPINRMTAFSSVHTPVSGDHMLTLVVMALVGFVSYLILKFAGRHLAPLAKVLCIGGVYGGMIVNVLFLIQLICGARPEGISSVQVFEENVIFILSLCIVPVLFFIHVADMFKDLIRRQAEEQMQVKYENGFLAKCNAFLLKGAHMYWAALIAMIPLYGIVICILCLLGQKPDSVIQAFTKTSDWVLSQEISPPPVEYDAHYLCTVSLQGHRGLVKPTRYGIRRGQRIVVNRQLCVANAFEQLLEERTPRFHRAVRNFYDTYGYPISKWITNPWSADVVYLLMKPLEWIFVIVLYFFDAKPENRISTQYLPGDWKKEPITDKM